MKILHSEGSEALAQSAQRAVGAPSLEVLKAILVGGPEQPESWWGAALFTTVGLGLDGL